MAATTHLRSLQALEMALRTGSLRRAAQQLAITPAAVGQRIRLLEDYLGLDLLVRGRSGILPTPALQKALPHLTAAFGALDAVTAALDFQRVDEIHMVADTDWEELWLKPRIGAFRQANPSTRFCINGVGDVPLRLGQEDCRIWFGAPRPDEGCDLLFRDYLLPIASPENAARVARVARARRLEGFPLLHLDKYAQDPSAIGWPEWIRRHGHRRTAPDRGIRYGQLTHALEAVRSNAGALLCGMALLFDALDEGQVTPLFPAAQGAWTRQAYHVGFARHALRRSAVQRFRGWLLREGQATQARLEALAAGP